MWPKNKYYILLHQKITSGTKFGSHCAEGKNSYCVANWNGIRFPCEVKSLRFGSRVTWNEITSESRGFGWRTVSGTRMTYVRTLASQECEFPSLSVTRSRLEIQASSASSSSKYVVPLRNFSPRDMLARTLLS